MSGSPPSLVPGSLVGGVYRVRRPIGRGAMGDVFAADGPRGEKVALKVLNDHAARNAEIVARFQREAAIARTISSPYVATVLGAGQDTNGRLWIAFERLVGETLEERLRREQYLSFDEVAPIVEDALQGLAAAHGAEIIHRDIKPGNLFLEKRQLTHREIARGDRQLERTRILDFGVSKMPSRRSEPELTGHADTLGSVAYMAPEQGRDAASVDGRADLYALGSVAFRALAGRHPFEGNPAQVLSLKVHCSAPTLSHVTGDQWPKAIEEFLAQALAREREERFASVGDALHAWRRVCSATGNVRRCEVEITPPWPDEHTDVSTAVPDHWNPGR